MVAFVGMIGGLALLLVGFLGPWYVINVGILGSDYNAGLFLTNGAPIPRPGYPRVHGVC